MMYVYQICNCVSRMPYKALRHHNTDNGTIILRQKSVQFVYKYICWFLFIQYSLPVLVRFSGSAISSSSSPLVSLLCFCSCLVFFRCFMSAIRCSPSNNSKTTMSSSTMRKQSKTVKFHLSVNIEQRQNFVRILEAIFLQSCASEIDIEHNISL